MFRTSDRWFLNREVSRVLLLTNHVLEVLQFARPNNWGGCLLDTPGNGNLRHFGVFLLGQLFDTMTVS